MQERMFEMTCPHCGHVFHIKRDTIAIAGFNQTIDDRLLDGSYFLHRCSKCQQVFTMVHPFLYRDPKKKYVCILGKKIEYQPDLRERIFYWQDPSKFVFAIQVLHQNLDLELVLEIKEGLEKRYQKIVRLDIYDKEQGILWFYVDNQLTGYRLSIAQQQKVLYNQVM